MLDKMVILDLMVQSVARVSLDQNPKADSYRPALFKENEPEHQGIHQSLSGYGNSPKLESKLGNLNNFRLQCKKRKRERKTVLAFRQAD